MNQVFAMHDVLLAAAGFILFTVAVGLARVLRGPADVDRMMAAQLFATGGIAALLLVAHATIVPGVEDVALGLALLGAFASVAFVNGREPVAEISRGEAESSQGEELA
jgi:multicomponent Na+:H+ antiporter subunit F